MTDTHAYHGTELIVADDKQENDLESRIITQEKKIFLGSIVITFYKTSYELLTIRPQCYKT